MEGNLPTVVDVGPNLTGLGALFLALKYLLAPLFAFIILTVLFIALLPFFKRLGFIPWEKFEDLPPSIKGALPLLLLVVILAIIFSFLP